MSKRDELQALQYRISDDEGSLRAEGVIVRGSWSSDDGERVEVEVIAQDVETARRVMRDRYGDVVEIDYLGPDETTSAAAAWSDYLLDAPDRLTVFFTPDSIERWLDQVEVAESDDAVTITVFEGSRVGGGEKMPRVPEVSHTVDLERPLGNRRVIDGSTGVVRTARRRSKPA